MNINIQRICQNNEQLAANNNETVLVTGANGFISGHIINYLLQLNYKVRGTVRNVENKEKYSHFYDVIPEKFHKNLSFVAADLTEEKGWDEAVSGCTFVLHIASPLTYQAKTAEEMITPAVNGTKNVLNACIRNSKTIKKVVLTSSGKAIFEGNFNQHHFDESNWQNFDNAGFYGKSKFLAEKEAWKLYEENKDKLNLTVINPVLVLGPSLSKFLSASQSLITNILNGKLTPHPVCLPIVHVRDVAAAHILPIQNHLIELTRGKRYIICSQSMWVKDVAVVLSDHYKTKKPELKIQTKELTHEQFVEKSETIPNYKETLRQSGQYFIMDNLNSVNDLGMQYIGIHQTLIETSEEILKNGI